MSMCACVHVCMSVCLSICVNGRVYIVVCFVIWPISVHVSVSSLAPLNSCHVTRLSLSHTPTYSCVGSHTVRLRVCVCSDLLASPPAVRGGRGKLKGTRV